MEFNNPVLELSRDLALPSRLYIEELRRCITHRYNHI